MEFRTRLSRTHAVLFLAAGLALAGTITGCGRDDEEPRVLARTGRVASINKETGVVEMWIYSPKHRQEIKIDGTLAPEAEILINGATADLDDVRIDDQVMVQGEVIRSDLGVRIIATKVEVTRPVDMATPPEPPADEPQ
jgi:hypothetical protein